MTVDFSRGIKTLDGQQINDSSRDGVVMTVGLAAVNALLAEHPSESAGVPAEEKLRRYKLAVLIHAANGPVGVSVEDVALIRRLIGFCYPPIVVGQAYEVLDGA
jgi:hypothetical protein